MGCGDSELTWGLGGGVSRRGMEQKDNGEIINCSLISYSSGVVCGPEEGGGEAERENMQRKEGK